MKPDLSGRAKHCLVQPSERILWAEYVYKPYPLHPVGEKMRGTCQNAVINTDLYSFILILYIVLVKRHLAKCRAKPLAHDVGHMYCEGRWWPICFFLHAFQGSFKAEKVVNEIKLKAFHGRYALIVNLPI